MEQTSIFIPATTFLVEIFDSNELKSKGKASTLKPLDFGMHVRAPREYLGTKTYQAGLGEQVMGLLYRMYACQGRSIGFPEMSVGIGLRLRKIVKEGKIGVGIARQVQMFIEKVFGFHLVLFLTNVYSSRWMRMLPLWKEKEARLNMDHRMKKQWYGLSVLHFL
jgi:hypothetical protein